MSLAVNYHRWTYNIARPYLGKRVLEIGGGLGSFTRYLKDDRCVVTIDNDPVCTSCLDRQFSGHNQVRVLHGDILDDHLPEVLLGECLDSAVCINVLEHIEDDCRALHNIWRALEPGGHLVLLVPAHPRLYGTLDAVVGHFRRYTRSEGRAKMREAGFHVLRCEYFNSVGAAGRFVIGRISRQQETGKGQVVFYDRYVVPLLEQIERVVAPPFGQSLVVIGRKQAN